MVYKAGAMVMRMGPGLRRKYEVPQGGNDEKLLKEDPSQVPKAGEDVHREIHQQMRTNTERDTDLQTEYTNAIHEGYPRIFPSG